MAQHDVTIIARRRYLKTLDIDQINQIMANQILINNEVVKQAHVEGFTDTQTVSYINCLKSQIFNRDNWTQAQLKYT